MKKRIVSFLLCVVMLAVLLAAFQGCDDADLVTTTTATTTTEIVSSADYTTNEPTTMLTTELITSQPTTTKPIVVRPTTTQPMITTTLTTRYKPPSLLLTQTTTTTKPTTTQGETAPPIITNQYTYIVGGVCGYFVDGDMLHVVTKSPNLYIVVDTNTGAVLRVEYLPSQPNYMKRIDGKLWITYGPMRCIMVYDEDTFEMEEQFSFDFELFDIYPPMAFDVYGDYIFVAEEDAFGVWRYNMKTQEMTHLNYVSGKVDIAIDRNTGLVYIGESGHTGSKLYCIDAETLEIKSKYDYKGYGIDNTIRKVILHDNGVYWGLYKFALDDVSKILMTYETSTYHCRGMHYVTDKYVVDTAGFFDRVTGKLLWEKEMKMYYSHAAVTDSGNVMWTERDRFIIMTNRLS